MAKTDVVKAFTNALHEVMTVQFNEHIAMSVDKTSNEEKLSVAMTKFTSSLNDEQRAFYIELEHLESSVDVESLNRFYQCGVRDGLAIGRSMI